MKNYIIEDRETGRTVASGLAKSKRDARAITGHTSTRYEVTEATASGINYQPITGTHGGKRPNAGRKPAETPRKGVTVRLSEPVRNCLADIKRETGKSLPDIIEAAIKQYQP